jgi:hypothetical protein
MPAFSSVSAMQHLIARCRPAVMVMFRISSLAQRSPPAMLRCKSIDYFPKRPVTKGKTALDVSG